MKVDAVSATIAKRTRSFVETKLGKLFLSLVLLGPLTFIPTIYQALTIENIDAFRTWTWPLALITVLSSFLGLVHNGDWKLRLVTFLWIVVFFALCVIITVR